MSWKKKTKIKLKWKKKKKIPNPTQLYNKFVIWNDVRRPRDNKRALIIHSDIRLFTVVGFA